MRDTTERVATKTTARILGASTKWVIAKMERGELPIGIYTKNGNKADPKIFVGLLAAWLNISREELVEKIEKVEGGEHGAETGVEV